jgi:hypothetical protein
LKFCSSCTVCPRNCPPPVCPDTQADRQKKISASGNKSHSAGRREIMQNALNITMSAKHFYCVCVREREREKDKEREREREKERKSERERER